MILILLLLIPALCSADIFAKPDNQTAIDQALVKDVRNNYLRGNYDYNSYEKSLRHNPQYKYELSREGIPLGASRFSFHESLRNLMNKDEFNSNEINFMMNKIALPSSRLLFWQYSSPAVADLYKHSEMLGYLRLAMRYQQYDNLEQAVGDPLIKLRKQAVLDCIRRNKNRIRNNNLIDNITNQSEEQRSDRRDIEAAFYKCFDDLTQFGDVKPFEDLEDPENGNNYINNKTDITSKVLDRVNKEKYEIDMVKQILPRASIDKDSVFIEIPDIKSRELINKYRKELIDSNSNGLLLDYLNFYKVNKDIPSKDSELYRKLNVFGVPISVGQVKNLLILDDNSRMIELNKIASNLSYLKTIDQFLLASQMLDRVMSHPAIQPGYKTLLQSSLDYVNKEIVTLKEERERLSQYADTMRSIVNEADQIRDKTIKHIESETNDQATKGLFKLGL